MCGSTISVQLEIKDSIILAYAHVVKACALSSAAAAVVHANAIGCTTHEIRELREIMRHMLEAGGPPPTGKWAELEALSPIKDLRIRHDTVMLVFDAMIDAFGAC